MSVSSLTTDDVLARVRARFDVPLALVPRAEHNIALCIAGGLERLGRAVKDSLDRHLLITSLNATPAAGVIDLSTATYRNILIDTFKLPGGITTQAELSTVFKQVASLDALRATSPADTSCVWFNLTGTKLTFKHPTSGALNSYATAVVLRGSYIPTLDTTSLPMPAELDDQLIDQVAGLVKQLGGMSFLKMDDDLAAERVGGN